MPLQCDDMDETDDEQLTDRKFVSALARGLEVLRCFRPGEIALSNNDISERTGLPKPTVTRLTHTLRKLGYLVYSDRTGNYQLGAGVLSLGYGVLSGMEMRSRAAEYMDDLCSGPNPHVTVALAERHRLSAVYVDVRRSNQTVALTMNIGARLPVAQAAIGRAMLAVMPEEERRHMLGLIAEAQPDQIEETRAAVDRAIAQIAEKGYCTSFGEWRPEVNGIAAPILSPDGSRIFALNVGGPSFLVSPEDLIEDYGSRLVAVSRALSLPRDGRAA